MKAVNFYSLIVTLLLVLVCILYFRSCDLTPDKVVEDSKEKYDSLTSVIKQDTKVIEYLHRRYHVDSLHYEQQIASLKKEKRSGDQSVFTLKKKVNELTKKYEEAKSDTPLALLYCDSLAEQNEILLANIEEQTIITDSIIAMQEQEIDTLKGSLQSEIAFNRKFLQVAIQKDKQYNILYDAYSKIEKKHKSDWNRWIKPLVIGAGSSIITAYIVKSVK